MARLTASLSDTKPIRGVFPESMIRLIIDEVFLDFSIETVVPGQPITLTWQFWSSHFTRKDLGSGYRVDVYFHGNRIQSFPSTGYYAYAGDPFDPFRIDSGVKQEKLDVPAPFSPQGAELYTIGEQNMTIALTTNGQDSGPYYSTGLLRVVPEAVDASWWSWPQQEFFLWGSARGPLQYWKRAYNIQGRPANKSIYVWMSVKSHLDEDEQTLTGGLVTRDYPFTQIKMSEPGNPTSDLVQLPVPIVKDWGWLTPVIWYPEGPMDKTFRYTARFTLEDSYGNTYPEQRSGPLLVEVKIEDKKVYLAEGAFAAGIIALTLTIAAKCLPFLAIPAAVAAGIANLLGGLANDPPEPNARFLEEVQPVPFRLTPRLHRDDTFAPIGPFFETLGTIIMDLNTLTEIHCRILGARQAFSRRGLEIQEASYRQVLRQMVSDSNRLVAATDEAVRWLDSYKELRAYAVRAFLAKNKRAFSREFAAHLKKEGLSEARIKWATTLLRNPSIRKVAGRGVGSMLRAIAFPVVSAVRVVEREADVLLHD